MKKLALPLAVAAALIAFPSFAGTNFYSLVPGSGSASKTDTHVYAGLNWRMGGGTTPALVLGAFRAKVESDGDTSGANLAFHLNLAGGAAPGKLKLGYIHGQENFQGEAAVGYDFLKQAPLLGLGVNAPHINAGVDVYSTSEFVPFATLHSQGKFKKPQNTATQCVQDANGTFIDPDCTTPIPD